MERLTKKLSNGVADWNYSNICYGEDTVKNKVFRSIHRQNGCNRLAAYEDTGLAPEEIEDIVEMFHSYRHICAGIESYRLSELVKAEKEGRCVVLNIPCKPLVWGDDEQNTCLCPDCGKDLMGIPYGERRVLQCPECGQYLDATKIVTHKEAQEALKEREARP